MNNDYKSALDKVKLREEEKERLMDLFYNEDIQNRKGSKNNMKLNKFLKPCLAVAAGLAIVLTGNIAIPNLQNRQSNTQVQKVSGNSFSLTAYAKEITKTGKIFPDTQASLSYAMGWDDNGNVSFSFQFPIQCKGENIDTVTYKIKDGAFQISNPKGKSIVVDGEKPDKEFNVPGGTKGEDLEDDNPPEYEFNQYKSFTLNYDNQINNKTCIEIIDTSDVWTKEKINKYKNLFGNDLSNLSLEDNKKLFDFFTKNLGIVCTVKYKDGSTETKNISVANEIVKPSDILNEEIPEEKNQKIVARFFSIE